MFSATQFKRQNPGIIIDKKIVIIHEFRGRKFLQENKPKIRACNHQHWSFFRKDIRIGDYKIMNNFQFH